MRTTIFAAVLALATVVAAEFTCVNPHVTEQTTAGQNGEVVVKALQCENEAELRSIHDTIRFARRQSAPVDVCGNTCNTNCFSGQVGTGPNPNDCQIIADALLYDSQNVGPLFTTDPANSTAVVTMQYQTCEALFINQAGVALQYCRTDFSSLTHLLAFNCQAQQNAHGGNCVATDQRWFVQVQHV
ncbi:hypothetical protein K488DRAFT_70631 [Vararia minispora EC-137]|uniref:Uncharacterized protein n=1 Tax=Vararia minispora EC-137 TaxID=1314806 RepID=A0ACB8QKR9_9AGAM|nr:hypothetical protein K488DRAFT_70631 [Vararia minispora EC-137]